MFCGKCGKEVPEGKSFCTSCGEPVIKKEEAKAATPAPPPAAAAPQPPVGQVAPPPAPGQAPAPPVTAAPAAGAAPKKRKAWPIIVGVVCLLVIVAVVLVLVLVVFKGSSPSSTVASFFKAVENKDNAAAMATIDVAFFKGNSELESTFKREVLDTMPEGVKFKGMQYSTQTSGDKATVNVTKGTATYAQDGKTESVDITKLEGGNKFDMVKVDGKWLISPTTFGGVFAKAYKDAADKIFEEEIVPKSSEMETAFKNLSASMSAQPTPTAQQLTAQLASVEAVLKDYRKLSEEAKSEYEKVADLSGTGTEEYKKYAKAAIGFIDTSLEVFDESIAFLKYVIDVKAKSETGTVPDMNVYNQKTSDYTTKVTELEQQLSEYQEQMDSLDKELN